LCLRAINAYRVTVAGPSVARGAAELTVLQLQSLMSARDASISVLAPISNRWEVAVNYYARFALPCSAIAFPLFGVCAARLGRMSRRLLVLATASAYIALFLVIDPHQVRAFSPFLVAWCPTLSIAAIALLIRLAH
jgi:lipopolysaccharide export LptBFGC system permease protein LptF